MAIRKYNPTTPGRRHGSVSDFSEITRSYPEKSLVRPITKTGGRNSYGRVTSRHRGGGHKRAYRLIDFKRNDKDGVPARVAQIEYDPNRTANIALLHYADGEKRYIIAPQGVTVGTVIENGPKADIKPGNNLPMRNITLGKAGRARWKGQRPKVRGLALNPVDLPHGGGEGRTSGGRHPVSPWGKPEGRTRRPNKASDKQIVRRRRTGNKR